MPQRPLNEFNLLGRRPRDGLNCPTSLAGGVPTRRGYPYASAVPLGWSGSGAATRPEVVIAEPQTKPAESNGRGLYVEPEGSRPRPGQRLDLARIAARRRALAARREELVVQRAALFSTFLELQEWRAQVAAECDAAIWMYRKQAAARSKERASAAQLVGFRRLAVIIDGRAQTIDSPIAPDRPGQVEGSCAAATSVMGLIASSGGCD